MTPYQKHCGDWANCRRCPLWRGRSRVVIARGQLPCDVLMVGEAPGQVEDDLGVPFRGPAGRLLDQIITQALPGHVEIGDDGHTEHWCCDLRVGFTNAVGCFPSEQKKTQNHAPPLEAIKACAPRVKELIVIARPRLICCVGEQAKKYIHLSADTAGDAIKFCGIMHPAAILRMPAAQKGLAVQKCVVNLRTAAEETFPEKLS